MASVAPPPYFELSWSILSTIGIGNTLFGILVGGITTFSPVCIVPIVTSASGAIANGLCYYAFYDETNPVMNRAVASVFADMAWMVQEAGYSFYSYLILTRILRTMSRRIFLTLFWVSMLGILVLRTMIAVLRFRMIHGEGAGRQELINHLHIGYFVLIALVECVSAFFLLRIFAQGLKMSVKAAIMTGPFRYLMRSTELRLALLAVLGTTRAVTYSFQATAQSATGVASQLDRFAYTMECLFPIMLLIDILASKLVYRGQDYGASSRHKKTVHSQARERPGDRTSDTFDTQQGTYGVRVQGAGALARRTSSEERIIPVDLERGTPEVIGMTRMDHHQSSIKKTIEVEVYTADTRG